MNLRFQFLTPPPLQQSQMCWFYVPTCPFTPPTSASSCYSSTTFAQISSLIANDFEGEVDLLRDLYESRENISTADSHYLTLFERTDAVVLNDIIDTIGQNATCLYKGLHNAACQSINGNDGDCQESVWEWLVDTDLVGHDPEGCGTDDCFQSFKELIDVVVTFRFACREAPEGLEEGLQHIKVRTDGGEGRDGA